MLVVELQSFSFQFYSFYDTYSPKYKKLIQKYIEETNN